MAYDEDCDFPYHERYTELGKRKEVDEFDRRMAEQGVSLNDPELRTYKCSCGYEFRQKPGKRITRCPYCGRGADAFRKKASAQDLLDDALDEE